jgi:hypothetical protein
LKVVYSRLYSFTNISKRLGFDFLRERGDVVTKFGKMASEKRVVVYHASAAWLKAYIPYERKDWIQAVKKIPGRWWATRDKCWMLPNKPESFDLLSQLFGNDLELNSRDISPPRMQPKLPPKGPEKNSIPI